MRSIAAVFVLVGLFTLPVAAQGRGGRYGDRAQGIPPGQLPPPGTCRVWYDNRPPGRQPSPTNCRDAERVASRDRSARVIYGGGVENNGRLDRNAPYPYPGSRNPNSGSPNGRGRYAYETVSFDNGYKDGYDKGREDTRGNRSYDPVRHSRYRSADHGYDRRLGTKEQYKSVYREGFEAGYRDGYRGTGAYRSDRRPGAWPF